MNSESANVIQPSSYHVDHPWVPSFSDIYLEAGSPWLVDKRGSSSNSSDTRNGASHISRQYDRGQSATYSFSFPEHQGHTVAESGINPSQEATAGHYGLTDASDYIESMFAPAASTGGPLSRKRLLAMHRMLAALCGRRDDVLHSLQGIRDHKLVLAEQKAAEEQRLIQALNSRLRASQGALDARLSRVQAQADEMERHARQMAAVLRGKHAHMLADDTQWQSIEAQFQRLMRQPIQASQPVRARGEPSADLAGPEGMGALSDTWVEDGSSLQQEEGGAAWDRWQEESRALQAQLSQAKESEGRLQQELSQARLRLEGMSQELRQAADGSSKLTRELDDARGVAQAERSAREKAVEELKAAQAKLDAMQAHEQALTTHLEQMRERYTEAVQMLELRHRNELSELCEEHEAKQGPQSQRGERRQPATPVTPSLSPLQADDLTKPTRYQAARSMGDAGAPHASSHNTWTPGPDRHRHSHPGAVPHASTPLVLGAMGLSGGGGGGPLGGSWYQQLLSRIQLNHMKEKERITRRHQEEMARQAEASRAAQPPHAASWHGDDSPTGQQGDGREVPGRDRSINKSHAEVTVELSAALEGRLREMEAENAELRARLGSVAQESEVLVQYETYKVRSEMEAAMRQLEMEPAHVARSYEQKMVDLKEAHESELASTRAELARLAEALELRLQRSLADDGARAAEALIAKEKSIKASNRHLQECLERRDEDFSQLLKQLHALQSMARGGSGTASSTTSSSGTLTSSPSSSEARPGAGVSTIPERDMCGTRAAASNVEDRRSPSPTHGGPTQDEESSTHAVKHRDQAEYDRVREGPASAQCDGGNETPAAPRMDVDASPEVASVPVHALPVMRCTRCGADESENAGPCRFHPHLTPTAGPYLYSREWHACRVDRHQQGTLGCVELPEHHFRPSPAKHQRQAPVTSPASPAHVIWPSPSPNTSVESSDPSLSLNRRSSSPPSLQAFPASAGVQPAVLAPRTNVPVPAPAVASPSSKSFSFGMTPASARACVLSPESVTSAAPQQKGVPSFLVPRHDVRTATLHDPGLTSGGPDTVAALRSTGIDTRGRKGHADNGIEAATPDVVEDPRGVGSTCSSVDGCGNAEGLHGGTISCHPGQIMSKESMGSMVVELNGRSASTSSSLAGARLKIPRQLIGPAQLYAGALRK